MIKNLYNYRELFKTTVLKSFRGKYKKSILGVLWSFISPLLQLLIYTFVFSFIMKREIENYSVFLLIGLIPWNFFNLTVNSSSTVILQSGQVIKKVYFPREILPVSLVTENLINFLISCIIIVCALLVSNIGISIYILLFPFILLIEYILLVGISLILSSITVYVRDLTYFINILMMLFFYLNPIVYPASIVPKEYLPIFNLNPMFHIINAYRDILYYKTMPNITILLTILGLSIIILMIGYKIFSKLDRRFAEEL